MLRQRERVSVALDLLTAGLYPFVEGELKAVYRHDWHDAARGSFRDERGQAAGGSVIRWDAHSLLTVMWDQWNRVFRRRLKQPDRSLVSELRDFRNRWAHQAEFDFDDTYRILDSAERLLRAVGAPEAERLARDKHDLLRERFSREARAAYKKSQISRRKLQDFSIYLACCASLVFVLFQHFGPQAWPISTAVVFVFAYLAYQRTKAPPPVFFGPHECYACGKIIYGEECPYCEPLSRRQTRPDAVSSASDRGTTPASPRRQKRSKRTGRVA